MFINLLKKIKSNKGNSLAEFAVTTAMMATLATTAAPKFGAVGSGAKEKKTMNNIDYCVSKIEMNQRGKIALLGCDNSVHVFSRHGKYHKSYYPDLVSVDFLVALRDDWLLFNKNGDGLSLLSIAIGMLGLAEIIFVLEKKFREKYGLKKVEIAQFGEKRGPNLNLVVFFQYH